MAIHQADQRIPALRAPPKNTAAWLTFSKTTTDKRYSGNLTPVAFKVLIYCYQGSFTGYPEDRPPNCASQHAPDQPRQLRARPYREG